jgi:hypothetical protein
VTGFERLIVAIEDAHNGAEWAADPSICRGVVV